MNHRLIRSCYIFMGVCFLLLVLTILLISAVPPVSRDALTHHLAVPKIWLEKGLFKELPAIPFSYYPMNLDLLYLIPLRFNNDIVPKYIHFAFALLTAFLIFNYLKRRLNDGYGMLGALFFLSVPVIVKLSTTVYVDLGLIFFSTAALMGLIGWVEAGFKLNRLLLSAMFCGLALGTKYNGLIVLFLLSSFIPFMYLRGAGKSLKNSGGINQLKALGFGVVFAVAALLVFSPWMIRNTILTGNPLYPLYQSVFTSEKSGSPTEADLETSRIGKQDVKPKNDGWKHFAVRKVVYGESLWQICLIPLRVFFEGEDDDPKHFDGRLNPFLIVLPLLLLIPNCRIDRIRSFENRLLALYAVVYLMVVFFKVDMRIRWIGPIIPCLVILSVLGLAQLLQASRETSIQWKSRSLKAAMAAMIVVTLMMNATYIHALYKKIDPLPYLFGKIGRDAYIEKFRPEYSLIRYVNQQLPDNAILLCLFIGDRIYYFDRHVYLDKNLLINAVNSADSVDQVGRHLETAGITHIFMRFDLTLPWINRTFEDKKKTLLKTYLQNRAKQLAQNGDYGLFKIQYGN